MNQTVVIGLFATRRELGVAVVRDPAITVLNIVSSADPGGPIDLDGIVIGLGLEHGEYETVQVPGLEYRLDDLSVVVLLLGSACS